MIEKDKALLDSVTNVMKENQRIFEAEKALLGEMGMHSRKAMTIEQRADFDAKLKEKIKT